MSGTLAKRRRPQFLIPTPDSLPRLREVEDLLARLWHTGADGLLTDTLSPSIDLSETDKSIDVRMDIPGVTADDIDVRVNGNLLTISGERNEEKEEKGRTFHRIERTEGSFSRSITLPCEVQESKVVAAYKDGVLNLSMPKCAEAKSHKIKIGGV